MTVHNQTEEIKLEEWEMICDVCNGTGENPQWSGGDWWSDSVCPKCQGEKKLDWVSVATGVAKKVDPWNSSGSSSGIANHTHGNFMSIVGDCNVSSKISIVADEIEIDSKPMSEYIQDMIASRFAEEIDKKVLEALQNQKEQIIKKRRKFFDNRFISKFLFFCNFKQRVQNKKDKNTI